MRDSGHLIGGNFFFEHFSGNHIYSRGGLSYFIYSSDKSYLCDHVPPPIRQPLLFTLSPGHCDGQKSNCWNPITNMYEKATIKVDAPEWWKIQQKLLNFSFYTWGWSFKGSQANNKIPSWNAEANYCIVEAGFFGRLVFTMGGVCASAQLAPPIYWLFVSGV